MCFRFCGCRHVFLNGEYGVSDSPAVSTGPGAEPDIYYFLANCWRSHYLCGDAACSAQTIFKVALYTSSISYVRKSAKSLFSRSKSNQIKSNLFATKEKNTKSRRNHNNAEKIDPQAV